MELKLRKELGELKRFVYSGGNAKDDYVIRRVRSELFSNDDLLSSTSDKVFKMMFQNEENKKYACYLLSLLFEVDWKYLYEHMKLYNTELKMDNVKDKNEKVNFVGLVDDVFFTIEMNNTNELERNEAYVNKLAIAFVKPGSIGGYKYVVQLNLNNFKIRGLEDTIMISETTDGRFKRTKKTYIDIYLPNINKKYVEKGMNSLSIVERRTLGMFISKKSKALELIEKEEILMDFIKKLQELNNDEGLLRSYDHELVEKEEARREGKEEGRAEGREEGRKEGRAEGREEGREETAKEMLKKGFNIKDIVECTKLSEHKIKSIIAMM